MQIKHKNIRAILIVLFTMVIAFSAIELIYFNTVNASAEAEQDYYYAQLNADAKRFYNAIDDMNKQGLLKQGNAKYDLVASKVLTKAQLNSYSSSSRIMANFGAARDAYYLDHPEVFYVDFSYLSVSVGKQDGKYVATLGTGRSDSYLLKGFTSSTVEGAITEFDAGLKSIIDNAASKQSVVDKIKSVNAAISSKNVYSFCEDDAASAPFIRSAYGVFVKGKSVCEGYARSFKCAMDALEIPCVIIQGYASYDGGLEPHAWNAVKIDDSWYGVDPTWNDTAGDTEGYLLLGSNNMNFEHISDGIISAANYKFNYPLLTPNDYGEAEGSSLLFTVASDDNYLYVGYNGKNCTDLESEGLYLAYRMYSLIGSEYSWSVWSTCKSVLFFQGLTDGDGLSPVYTNNNVKYIQYAVINIAPNSGVPVEGLGYFSYDINLPESNIVDSSKYYENSDFTPDASAPFVKSSTPDHASVNLDATKTYEITITYTKELEKVNESQPVTIKATPSFDATAMNYAVIEEVKWDASKPDTVTFKFTPSAMYQHRDESYSFVPENLVGKDSGKAPNAVTYITKNNNVACNKVYGDGRLYVNTYGAPSLVGSGDLSMSNWTDANGKQVGENQRSQLMLVATKPTETETQGMSDNINDKLPSGSVKKSETFEISMNLCKNIVKIPNGSTVQVAFGFPEGYGPDDAGVTFKVYHFKRGDDGKIDYSKTEEIECVITPYGLVVNVTDFSPFAVVAVDKSQVTDLKKSLFVRSVGFGGSFECVGLENGESAIARLVDKDESVTYKINTDGGYRVAKVTLNGENITVNGDNTFTLSYDQLADSNAVEIHYVADSVADYESEHGIEFIYPCVNIGPNPTNYSDGGSGISKGAIAGIVVAILVVAVAACAVVLLLVPKLKKKAK